MNYLVNEQTKTVIDITGNESNREAVQKLLEAENVQIGNFTLNALLKGTVEQAAGFTFMDSEDLADSGVLQKDFVPEEIVEVEKEVEKEVEVEKQTEGSKVLQEAFGIKVGAEGIGKLGDSTVNEEKRVYTKKEQTAINARSGIHAEMVKCFEESGTFLNYVATDKEGGERWLEFTLTEHITEDKKDSRKNPCLFVSPTKKGYNVTLYLAGRSSGCRLKILTAAEDLNITEMVTNWVGSLSDEGQL